MPNGKAMKLSVLFMKRWDGRCRSATKRSNVDRLELDNLLDLCRSRTIRKVLVTGFSRLGRRRSETPALMPGRRRGSYHTGGCIHLRSQLRWSATAVGDTPGQWEAEPGGQHCH